MEPVYDIALDDEWSLILTNTGNRYYYNSITHTACWNYPNNEVADLVLNGLDREWLLLMIAKSRGLRVDRVKNNKSRLAIRPLTTSNTSDVQHKQKLEPKHESELRNVVVKDGILLENAKKSNSLVENPILASRNSQELSSNKSRSLPLSGYASSSDDDSEEQDNEEEEEGTSKKDNEKSHKNEQADNKERTQSDEDNGLEESNKESDEESSDSSDDSSDDDEALDPSEGINLDELASEDDEEEEIELTQLASVNQGTDSSNYVGNNLELTLPRSRKQKRFLQMLSEYSLDVFNPWKLESEKLILDSRYLDIENDKERQDLFNEWAASTVNNETFELAEQEGAQNQLDDQCDNQFDFFLDMSPYENELNPSDDNDLLRFLEFLTNTFKAKRSYIEFREKYQSKLIKENLATFPNKEKVYIEFMYLKQKELSDRIDLLTNFLNKNKKFQQILSKSQLESPGRMKALSNFQKKFSTMLDIKDKNNILDITTLRQILKNLEYFIDLNESIKSSIIYAVVPTKFKIKTLIDLIIDNYKTAHR